jgi:hypothetical protein
MAMNESANRSAARGRQTTYLAEVAGRHGAQGSSPARRTTMYRDYSQAGVQFAYSMGWTLLFAYPLMCAIQLMACSHELACAARGSLRSVQKLSLSAICRIAVDRDSALSPA